jgi:hypothetical protein
VSDTRITWHPISCVCGEYPFAWRLHKFLHCTAIVETTPLSVSAAKMLIVFSLIVLNAPASKHPALRRFKK